MLLTTRKETFFCGLVGTKPQTDAEMMAYVRWFLRLDPKEIDVETINLPEPIGIVVR